MGGCVPLAVQALGHRFRGNPGGGVGPGAFAVPGEATSPPAVIRMMLVSAIPYLSLALSTQAR